MKRDEKALDRIISRLSKEWQADGRKAVDRLYSLLKRGKKTAEAIDIVRKEYPALFTVINVQPALIEAAAYGYGIVPSVLTVAQWDAWGAALSTSWDGSGMTLSKKLHGADTKMREAITDTIRDQLKRNATWTEAAKALYDGYEHGNVVQPQQLPKYLSAVRYATQGSPEALAEARKVFYNIERLSRNGAPTKSLRAAYSSLVRAAQSGTEEQLEKACYVAVQEKSRYVAQRIIRTELSRAYSDGFVAKIMQDDDVVAVRLRLSTRHPVFDICNLFAEADMYGLGKGVYPKDKMPPVPLHPHCMCRYEEVYAWEVDISKQKDNVKQAGDKWLNGLSDSDRRKVLGIEGDEAWKQGENWQKYMRNWRGTAEPETRLSENVLGELQGQGKKTTITQKTIDGLAKVKFPGFTGQENGFMQQRLRELLVYARDNNNSNEVAFVLSKNLKEKLVEKGGFDNVTFSQATQNKILTEKGIQILHNHPSGFGFSFDDLSLLRQFDNVKGISLITNKGHVETLQKTETYDKVLARNIVINAINFAKKNNITVSSEKMNVLLRQLEKEGLIVWKK